MSQLPQAGLEEPIHTPSPWKMSRTQPVPFCLHGLCSACIQHWDRQNVMCLLCRQLFQLLLCSVPAESHSKEYKVPSHDHCHSSRPRGEPQCPAGSCIGTENQQRAAASLEFCWLLPSINIQMLSKSWVFFFVFNTRDPSFLGNAFQHCVAASCPRLCILQMENEH